MIGVIDESTPFCENGRVAYSLALVVFPKVDSDNLRWDLSNILNRKRPFHWADEGDRVRSNLISNMTKFPIRVHVCAALTSSKQQEEARRSLFSERLLPSMAFEGVTDLLIEQRSAAQDAKDRLLVRDWCRSIRAKMPSIVHVGKENPFTWFADAASGIWSDNLLGRGDGSLSLLANNQKLIHAWWE